MSIDSLMNIFKEGFDVAVGLVLFFVMRDLKEIKTDISAIKGDLLEHYKFHMTKDPN